MASRLERARTAGRRYARDQLGELSFLDWVIDELFRGKELEARSEVAKGLETENLVHRPNAMELARRMLQDVRYETGRQMSHGDIVSSLQAAKLYDPKRAEMDAFMDGVRAGYDSTQAHAWLADVIQDWAQHQVKQPSRHADRRSSRRGPRSAARTQPRSSQPLSRLSPPRVRG